MNFTNQYDNWSRLTKVEKKSTIKEVVAFYEDKTIQYILAHIKKEIRLDRKNVTIEYVDGDGRDKVLFDNNIVYVGVDAMENGRQQKLFFDLAQKTVCAVFLNLFSNTASNPNRKTSFGSIANSYALSITSEFVNSISFQQAMMESFAMELGESMGVAME